MHVTIYTIYISILTYILADLFIHGRSSYFFVSRTWLEKSLLAWLQALISLNSMYDKHRANGSPVPSETEFRAYHLLTMIGTHGRYGYNSSEFQNALLVLAAPSGTPLHVPANHQMHATAVHLPM